MSLLSNMFRRKPLPKPIVSVGPIPRFIGDDTEEGRHLPWKCAKSIVSESGCVSLLGKTSDPCYWTSVIAMCSYHKLRLCPQYSDCRGHAVTSHDGPWAVNDIETLLPLPSIGRIMCSVAYDIPVLPHHDIMARDSARYTALNMSGHVAFSMYPQLSGVHDITQLRQYLAPLVTSCRKFKGKRWVSECGVDLNNASGEFQATLLRLLLAIPDLAGLNYTLVCDSPGYAEACKDRGGQFWARQGLCDVNGVERPAADVLRKAAQG